MKRISKVKTVTYDAGDGFLVDIVENTDERNGIDLYEAYIYRNYEGMKQHMFGLLRNDVTKREFIKIVKDNLKDYKYSYDEETELLEYAHCELEEPFREDFYEDDGEYHGYVNTDDELESAAPLKQKYVEFVKANFHTKNTEMLERFLAWQLRTFGAKWWIMQNDMGELFDMSLVAMLYYEWHEAEWWPMIKARKERNEI